MTFATCCIAWASANASVGAIAFSRKDGVDEILNLQPKGCKAKPYQVKQVRGVIIEYRIGRRQR